MVKMRKTKKVNLPKNPTLKSKQAKSWFFLTVWGGS